MNTPCLDCGATGRWRRGRCVACESAYQRRRNASPKRRAYRDPEYRSVPVTGLCALCGKPGTARDPLTRDHLVPVALGGTARDGIRIVHRSENSSRGAKPA